MGMITKKILPSALIALCVLLVAADIVTSQTREEVREEFHQTYPLQAMGRVSVENINGAVRIMGWDRNEVKVDAIKTAYTRERLAEAQIRVDATADSIRIRTDYPDQNLSFTNKEARRYNNPASVEYTISVPRAARIESVQLVNGALDIEGVTGDVNASCVNGQIKARGLAGVTKLSTINGSLEAAFDQLDESKTITLGSVNGQIILTIPSDANAEVRANTVHGGIKNDFGLPVRDGEYVGHSLAGTLGRGGARIKLNNVNGAITIRHAADGRPVSSATNLLPEKRASNSVAVDADASATERRVNKELKHDMKAEVRREIERNKAEIERAVREAQRQASRELRHQQRELERVPGELEGETNRIHRDAERATRGAAARAEVHRQVDNRLVTRETKSFTVGGVPRVNVETFDGSIAVRAWDRPEVAVTAIKRATDENEMRGIRLRTEQRGAEIFISAEFDRAYAQQVNPATVSSNASVQLELSVPRQANLRATSGDGSLSVVNVKGEINVRTGDGSIDVRDSSGRLVANTGDGAVRIINFDGEAEARTGDGRITLDGRFAQLAAHTGAGSISLALPANTDAAIQTRAERVINDGLAVAEDEASESRLRRWRVGRGGSNLLKLQTGAGRIILHRSDSTPSTANNQ